MKKALWVLVLLFVCSQSVMAVSEKVNAASKLGVSLSNADKSCTTVTEPSQGVYLGIFREGAPRNMSLVTDLEKKINKKFSIVMWYLDWNYDFPADLCTAVAKDGGVPHIVWEPWIWGKKDAIKLDDIIAGKWDNHIRKWAKDIKKWGGFIFIRWGHEFNIDGYPWGVINNGKNPKKYVDAYRHVKDIFNREGAKNAKFVWTPMNESWPPEKWNDMHLAYPGDDYVDWIGIDGYNWGTTQDWSSWRSFKDLFRSVARDLWRRYPTKPIMIAEFATAPEGGDVSKWITEIATELKKMPYIKAIQWFDLKKESDWRIESSAKSLAAFKKLASDPYFFSDVKDIDNVCSVSGMVVERKRAVAKYAVKPITIDGKITEWTDSSPLVIEKLGQVQEGSTLWKGPKDLSGRIYVKWDDKNLYLAAEITDNHPLMNSSTNQNVWRGDAIEVVLGLDKHSKSDRFSFSKTDHQIGIGTGNGKNVNPTMWLWTKNMNPANGKLVVKKTATSSGYTMEAMIPWASMSGFSPSSGDVIPFDCALDDADMSGQRAIQMVWNGDFLFYKDPGVWGELEFVR